MACEAYLNIVLGNHNFQGPACLRSVKIIIRDKNLVKQGPEGPFLDKDFLLSPSNGFLEVSD